MSRGRSTGRGEEEGLRRVDGDAPQVVRVRLHLVHSFERVVVVHAQLHVVLHSHMHTFTLIQLRLRLHITRNEWIQSVCNGCTLSIDEWT